MYELIVNGMTKQTPAYFVSFNKVTEVKVQQSFRYSLDVVSKFE